MNERVDTLSSVLIGAFAAFWETILGFMPNLLATFLVLAMGLFLAKFSKIVVDRLLKLFRFEALVQKTGLETYIASSGYDITFSNLISGTVYWLVILMTVTSIADLLHLEIISDLFERIVIYLPNVILAVVILILGTIFSRIVNRYVFNNLKERAMDLALSLGITAEVIVLIFTWFLALEQLQINTVLLLIVLTAVLSFLTLAGGIAFGLSGQKFATELLNKMRAKIEGGINEEE